MTLAEAVAKRLERDNPPDDLPEPKLVADPFRPGQMCRESLVATHPAHRLDEAWTARAEREADERRARRAATDPNPTEED